MRILQGEIWGFLGKFGTVEYFGVLGTLFGFYFFVDPVGAWTPWGNIFV